MRVIVVSYNKFPDGDAGAIREYSYGKLFNQCGYDMFFISMGRDTQLKTKVYNGFEYVSLKISKSGIYYKFINYFGYKSRLKKTLQKFVEVNGKIDAILVTDIPINALLFIKKYARTNNIKLLHDSVEWYSPEQFKLGKLAIPYILKDLMNRFWIDKQFIVIAISKYLYEHFRSRGIRTIRVPVILDVRNITYNKDINEGKLVILYAGSPGRKDYLNIIINGVALLNTEEINKIELRILGASKDQIIAESNVDEDVLFKLGNCINILGRVSREVVLKNLEQADFTVLMRSPIQRYAKAGFPTKIVESLACYTPVILNITSDIGDYITNEVNGLVVTDCTPVAVCNTIRRALALTYEEKMNMQKNARKCAEEYFDYRKYEKDINKLLC